MMSTLSKKVCLVGDFGVGKTSLIRQYVDRQFSDRYLSTVGVKISRKAINWPAEELPAEQPRSLQLLIWDIEGSTKFKMISSSYLQGAGGAIIVGDVTAQDTLSHVAEHIQQFSGINPSGAIVLALNKSDLIEREKLDTLLQSYQTQYQHEVRATYATSAKTGDNVDQIFQALAQVILNE